MSWIIRGIPIDGEALPGMDASDQGGAAALARRHVIEGRSPQPDRVTVRER
jgi:hypothetical protein